MTELSLEIRRFCEQKLLILKSPSNTKLENTEASKLQCVQNKASKKERQELGGLYNKAILKSGLHWWLL